MAGFAGIFDLLKCRRDTFRSHRRLCGRCHERGSAGLEFDVSEKVAITIEGRVYRFKQHTFTWEAVEAPPTAIEELLLDQLENELDPIQLEPIYFR